MKKIIQWVEWLSDDVFHCNTYKIENATVFLVLISVRIGTGGLDAGFVQQSFAGIHSFGDFWGNDKLMTWIADWLAVFGVLRTFQHANVAERMREIQAEQLAQFGEADVPCFSKLHQYFIQKEIIWFFIFVFLKAWSALVGVLVFMVYPYWRRSWRKYHSRQGAGNQSSKSRNKTD